MVAAARLLAERCDLRGVSRVFATDAVGGEPEEPRDPIPGFLNAAAEIVTRSGPRELKHTILRRIEEELGRVRTQDRNAPRTIDLDIAIFGELVVEEDGLVLPDPEILTRAHVAVPLADLAPEWRHPADGRLLREIARGLRSSENSESSAGVRPAAAAGALEDVLASRGVLEGAEIS